MVLEFQAVLAENNTIQLQHAQKLHFTVVPVIEKPVEAMTPDEAWQPLNHQANPTNGIGMNFTTT